MCAGCDAYHPWAACLIAFVSAFIHLGISALLVRFRIDDPVDAVAVHCGPGAWGLIMAPILR